MKAEKRESIHPSSYILLKKMPTTAQIPAPEKVSTPVIPAAVLDNLAARFRPGGLCLLMLGADGTLLYSDAQNRSETQFD